MTAQVICPHCQTRNIIPNVSEFSKYHVLKCGDYLDAGGGCEKPFAVRTSVDVKAEVYTITKWETQI